MIGGVSGDSTRRDTFVAVARGSCRGAGVPLAAWVPEHFKRGSCGQDTHHRISRLTAVLKNSATKL